MAVQYTKSGRNMWIGAANTMITARNSGGAGGRAFSVKGDQEWVHLWYSVQAAVVPLVVIIIFSPQSPAVV